MPNERRIKVNETLVIQSFHSKPWPKHIEQCITSVQSWANQNKYAYRLFGDEVLEILPPDYLKNCFGRWPVIMDLARLLLIKNHLNKCAHRVIWLDADTFVFAPDKFNVTINEPHLVGREIWVSKKLNKQWKTRKHVHNAFVCFTNASPVLDFLIYATDRIVTNLTAASSPQLVGPKLYTHLNNLIRFPIMETAGMMSPAVMKDLIAGQGPALNRHLKALKEPMAAVNLSRSLIDHTVDDVMVTHDLFDQTIAQLVKNFKTSGLENPN